MKTMKIAVFPVVALLLSMSGAALAETGASGSGGAAEVQYQTETNASQPITPTTPSPPPPTQQVAPAQATAQPAAVAPVAKETPKPVVKGVEQVQATEAEPVDAGALPFTGLATLPILLGGLAVLAFGLVLRHQTRKPDGR